MKLLWVLLLAAGPFALADDSDGDGPSDSSPAVQGRTGSSGSSSGGGGGNQGNTRFLGGGLNSLIGAGQALLGGVLGGIGNQNFGGGFQQGLGGGFQPGFGGGVQPGFGGGFQPGFGGGFQPGFGGIGGGFNQGFGAGCRFSCRAPNGQFVCCGNSGFGTKPGQCPPVRPTCPNVRNFAPPQPCIVDNECGGVDKCCFDTCLQERVCKPPSGFGR